MSDHPRTDLADDVTMRYSIRFERVRDLCRDLEREVAGLCLLEGMDAIEVSVLGTFLQGGDIPETVNAAHAQVVRRMLTAERKVDALREALAEVVRISDRKHDAWDVAHALLAEPVHTKGNGNG